MKRRRSFWGGIRVVKMNDDIDVCLNSCRNITSQLYLIKIKYTH